MKRILITGGSGQLGSSLTKLLSRYPEKYSVLSPASSALDITDAGSVNSFMASADGHIDIIVNCAAYTAVDNAENDIDSATRLNAYAPAILAEAANTYQCKLLHISTDYVFSGDANAPVDEAAATAPQSVYGKTKLLGEKKLTEIKPDAIILRTSWLYSECRSNFVKTMLRLGHTKSAISVVYDQVGSPTYAGDLAQAIKSIIDFGKWTPGIYHYSNEGVASWFDFAKAIFELAAISGCTISPCLSCEYPTPAARPHFSVLDKSKIKRTFNISIPYWRDSLKVCINNMITKNSI